MTRFCCLFIIFFLSSLPLYAAQTTSSLFFTPNEIELINKEIYKNRNAAQTKHLIHMGSLIYFSPERWVVWLKGKKWTPQTIDKNITILTITPDNARLLITLPNHTEKKEITLRPHQSFNLLTKEIIEGF